MSSSGCQQLGRADSVCTLSPLCRQVFASLARGSVNMSTSTYNTTTSVHFCVFKTERIERRTKIREEQRKGGQEKKGNRNKKDQVLQNVMFLLLIHLSPHIFYS